MTKHAVVLQRVEEDLERRERVSERLFRIGMTGFLLVNLAVWVLGYVALVSWII